MSARKDAVRQERFGSRRTLYGKNWFRHYPTRKQIAVSNMQQAAAAKERLWDRLRKGHFPAPVEPRRSLFKRLAEWWRGLNIDRAVLWRVWYHFKYRAERRRLVRIARKAVTDRDGFTDPLLKE